MHALGCIGLLPGAGAGSQIGNFLRTDIVQCYHHARGGFINVQLVVKIKAIGQ